MGVWGKGERETFSKGSLSPFPQPPEASLHHTHKKNRLARLCEPV